LDSQSQKQKDNSSEHFRNTNMVREGIHDPDLSKIVKVWPTLSEQIKTKIKALTQVHKGKEGSSPVWT
jgi:hypothetical protein